MKNIENPFIGSGTIVQGKNFFGRRDYLRALENRLTRTFGDDKGNIALVGYPKIGKSSIAAQSVLDIQSELQSKKKVPIWMNVGTFESRDALFLGMVTLVFYYFQDNNIAIRNLETAYRSVQDLKQSWSSLIIHVQRFFTLVKTAEYSVFFILDEFDHVRKLFKTDPNAFQALRDLAYRNFGVNYLITSRRTIREIEVQSTAISTFDGVISKHYVSLFTEDEVAEYYERMQNIGLSLSDDQKSQIEYYCGRHPYLLAALGYEIVEEFKEENEILVDTIFNKVELNFLQHYEHLVDLLNEDRTFDKLLQILFGPFLNVSEDEIKELKNSYGLIQEFDLGNNDKGLVAFSMHFQDYLRNLGKEVNFWALWTDLEVTLREVIFVVMKTRHQENWMNILKSRHFDFFQKAEELRERAREDFKSENLLDYLDAQPIFEIVYSTKNWADFRDIFGGDGAKREFVKQMELIIKIRNPYAHSRFKSINSTSVKQAEVYCEEILPKLKHFLNKH